MPKRIYVGNLPFSADSRQVEEIFTRYGKVRSVTVGRGRATVEMERDEAAERAFLGLRRAEVGGKPLKLTIESR